MKTILKLAVCVLVMQSSFAQTTLTDYFIVNKQRIEIEISKPENKYVIKLSKGDVDKNFNLGGAVGSFFDFKKQFRNIIYEELLEFSLDESENKIDKNALEKIDEKAESVYYSFANNLRVLDNLDYQPNTGILKVNDRIPIYLEENHFVELKKVYEDEVKKVFKAKIQRIDNLIKAKPIGYLDTLLVLTAETKVQEFNLNNLSVAEIEKENSKLAAKISELLSTKDTVAYKALENLYVATLFSQYIPSNIDKMVFTYLVIDNVDFEFSKGFLEVIKVSGHLDCDSDNLLYNCNLIPDFLKKEAGLILTNKYGIGFTSRKNYKTLANVSLSLNQVNKKFKKENFETLTRDTEIYNSKLKNKMFILMDDLINYDFYTNKLTRDFSPMDQKVNVEGGASLTLKKEETRKILEVEVFSDFQGFDAESPNGLIQMELSKHFNLNTRRFDGWRGLNWVFGGYGFFQYIEVAGGITKIEDKERRLNPERIDNEQLSQDSVLVFNSKRYSTPIDLLHYSNWNIGSDINVLLVDSPDLKYQFHINAGVRFGKTAIQDSIKQIGSNNLKPLEYSVSYWTFYPEVKMHLLPEERYGFYAMWRPKYVHLISDKLEFKSVANPITGDRRGMSNWVSEFEFKGYVDVGSKGQIFARWRLNHEMGYSANNFSQIQLGYSFYIFGRNEANAQ
ncbi:hypothetical protein EV196_10268 [Mariniflexile fucanivorans]|uniref:Uncharacterized protein n=1 Tax=Mariniflexile fucanivorans TaxID=264023 RepID=A0A4R1RNS8_9FLAO|nr:hypothetical protein [Mariniflexile fucanivorans]TCL67512.1 hypothetical protein EV196_10268 [Mariniflexile fucanivorans]